MRIFNKRSAPQKSEATSRLNNARLKSSLVLQNPPTRVENISPRRRTLHH
jgi:hypothetical protein